MKDEILVKQGNKKKLDTNWAQKNWELFRIWLQYAHYN